MGYKKKKKCKLIENKRINEEVRNGKNNLGKIKRFFKQTRTNPLSKKSSATDK